MLTAARSAGFAVSLHSSLSWVFATQSQRVQWLGTDRVLKYCLIVCADCARGTDRGPAPICHCRNHSTGMHCQSRAGGVLFLLLVLVTLVAVKAVSPCSYPEGSHADAAITLNQVPECVCFCAAAYVPLSGRR
jgi:hypothetical protein